MGAEFLAMLGSAASGTGAGTAASLAGSAANGLSGMFAAPAATGAATGMLGPASFGTAEGLFAAGAPTGIEALGGSALGGDAAMLGMKGLDLGGTGMGGGTSSLFGDPNGLDFMKWAGTQNQSLPFKSMQDAMKLMDDGKKQTPPMGSRPPGYNPQQSMEEQFARIMGWLKENGGRV